VNLPIPYPYPPMEAQLVEEIPVGENWQYEPKWDGFRCLIFRDRDEIYLQSKAGQPLQRYFPDAVRVVQQLKSGKFVLDCEIVIPVQGRLSFDDLLLCIHPAESRVRKLALEFPAAILAFDLVVDEKGIDLTGMPLHQRRRRLENFYNRYIRGHPRVLLSPATKERMQAIEWLSLAGSNMDGVVAKRADLPYMSGARTGMQKIKRVRTADCVVGRFRYASRGKMVGLLLLGLYNDGGLLDHVGFTSGLKTQERSFLARKLEKLVEPPGFTGRAPGGPSRWSTERTGEWQPLRPELVVEVQYDHFTGGRFRHGTRLVRWRPDKSPRQCTIDQVRSGSSAGENIPLAFP
jgi:ATP-dependent DNA ligase